MPQATVALSDLKQKLLDRLRAGEQTQLPEAAEIARAQGEHFPLSRAQERIWTLEQLFVGTPFHNLAVAYRISGPLDAALLQDALDEIERRHPALRTAFALVGDEPRQFVRAPLRGRLEILALDGGPEEEIQALAAFAATPFDISLGRPWRAALFRKTEGDHVLGFAVHHIVADGWSLGVFIGELSQLYGGTAQAPAEAGLGYHDYAAWEYAGGGAERAQRAVAHFTESLSQLGDPPVLRLPTRGERPTVMPISGDARGFSIAADLRRRVEHFAAVEKTTPTAVLLAAYQLVLARLSGDRAIITGMPVANRPRAETHGVIGCFFGIVPLGARIEDGDTFEAVVAATARTVAGALAHQGAPLQDIVKRLAPPRSAARHPLFQSLFVHQNAPVPPLQVTKCACVAIEAPMFTGSFDVSLFVEPRDAEYLCRVEYNKVLFEESLIVSIAAAFVETLTNGLAEPTSVLMGLRPRAEVSSPPPPDQSPRPEINSYLAGDSAGRAAATEMESLIMNWVAELTGRTDVTQASDFFDLGGDSLGMARLVNRARDRFGVEILLAEIYAGDTTVAGVAAHLDAAVAQAATRLLALVHDLANPNPTRAALAEI